MVLEALDDDLVVHLHILVHEHVPKFDSCHHGGCGFSRDQAVLAESTDGVAVVGRGSQRSGAAHVLGDIDARFDRRDEQLFHSQQPRFVPAFRGCCILATRQRPKPLIDGTQQPGDPDLVNHD
jgi:hypothetical protein